LVALLSSAAFIVGTPDLSALAPGQRDAIAPEAITAALPGHGAVLSAIEPHPRGALRPSTLLESDPLVSSRHPIDESEPPDMARSHSVVAIRHT
jgi:hypothetical protein